MNKQILSNIVKHAIIICQTDTLTESAHIVNINYVTEINVINVLS